MEYRKLGKSGLKISELSLGSWITFNHQVDVAAAKDLMAYAFDHGINFFDNAEAYANGRSEEIMGQVISELGWSRDEFCVSSKVFWGGKKPTQLGLSAKHIHDACHHALRRLQVDYLDLYFCHRFDPFTPIEEVVRAMHNLILQGKVLYWGTSEWSSDQIVEAYRIAGQYHLTPPTMEQPQYNMFSRTRMESEYLRLFEEFRLGTTVWSPLASGILTGKYAKGIPANSRATLSGFEWIGEKISSAEGKAMIEKTNELSKIAKDLGCPVATLAIAWILQNENVSSVILGASKKSQLEENIKASALHEQLSDDIMDEIEEILSGAESA